jgi:hypothetical protein
VKKGFKYTGCTAVFAAVFLMCGGHWWVLQSLAWSRMLVRYTRTDPLVTAVLKTFDGRHPCSLCLKVQEGWHEEQKQERKSPMLRLDKMPEGCWQLRQLTVPVQEVLPRGAIPFVTVFYSDFIDSPPVPPPRA